MGDPSIEGLVAALKAIRGPTDDGPFIETYRAAGGGYQGLQAIAEAALETSGLSDHPERDGHGAGGGAPGREPSLGSASQQDERRWTLIHDPREWPGSKQYSPASVADGERVQPGELVEVMPVQEHQEAMEEARRETVDQEDTTIYYPEDEMKRRVERAVSERTAAIVEAVEQMTGHPSYVRVVSMIRERFGGSE